MSAGRTRAHARVLLAAGLCALLAGCQAAVDLSGDQARYFRCDYGSTASATQCAGGWVCGKEGYCHPTDQGVQWQCDDATVCDPGWKCGLEGFCHASDAGVAWKCTSAEQCDPGWKCGLEGTCHSNDAGVAWKCTSAEQCDPGWKCGLEGTCHSNDAGVAYACLTEDNCDPGWRCSLNHVCAQAFAEALEPGAPDPSGPATLISPRLFAQAPGLLTRGDGFDAVYDVDGDSQYAYALAYVDGTRLVHGLWFDQGSAYGYSTQIPPSLVLQTIDAPAPPITSMLADQDLLIVTDGTPTPVLYQWTYDGEVEDAGAFQPFSFPPDRVVLAQGDFSSDPKVLFGFRRSPGALGRQWLPSDGTVAEVPLPDGGPLLEVAISSGAVVNLLTPDSVWAAGLTSDRLQWLNPDAGDPLDDPQWSRLPLAVSLDGSTTAEDPAVRWQKASWVSGFDSTERLALIGSKGPGAANVLAITAPLLAYDGWDVTFEVTNPTLVPEFSPCEAGDVLVQTNPGGFYLSGGGSIEDFTVVCERAVDGGLLQVTREYVCDHESGPDGPCTNLRMIDQSPVGAAQRFGQVPSDDPPVGSDPYGRLVFQTADPEWDHSPTLDRVPDSLFQAGSTLYAYARRNEWNEYYLPPVSRYVLGDLGFLEEQELGPFHDNNTQALFPEFDYGRVTPVQGQPNWAIQKGELAGSEPTVVRFGSDGGSRPLFDFPPLPDFQLGPYQAVSLSRPDAGVLLVATAFDSVLVGEPKAATERADGGEAGMLEIRAVPSSRSAIDALAVAIPAPSTGLVASGYVLSGHRIFSLSAPRVTDWRVQAIPLATGEPLAVWIDHGRGRVGLEDGRVFSLPNLVQLADAIPELAPAVTSLANLCGNTYAVGREAVYRLAAGADGLGTWTAESRLTGPLPGQGKEKGLAGGRLFARGSSLYLVTAVGSVARLDFASCPRP